MLVDRIRALHAQHPAYFEESRQFANYDIDRCFRDIRSVEHLTPDMFRTEAKYSIIPLLTIIPPREVYDQFGEEILIQCWLNAITATPNERFRKALVALTGRDDELLERARLAQWRLRDDADMRGVMIGYEMLEDGKEDRFNVPLERLLLSSAVADISHKRLGEYDLAGIMPRSSGPAELGHAHRWGPAQRGDTHGYNVYCDTPHGIALTYKGEPNAVVGFDFKENTFLIRQLQGVRKHFYDGKNYLHSQGSRGLPPLDWKKLMISICEEYAKQKGFAEMGIVSGHNNRWTKELYTEGELKGRPHLELEHALRIYDKTAKRLGYARRKRAWREKGDKNWYKSL